MSINRVTISGNLTHDPELRQTAAGMAVLSFGVAVNDRRKNNQTGQWEDYANFVDCTMFGQRAQALAPYLAKGVKVCIDGKLRYSSWERDGQKRSKLEVTVDDLDFMSQGQGQGGGRVYGGGQPQQATARPQPTAQQGYYAAPQVVPSRGYQGHAQPAMQPAQAAPHPVGYSQAAPAQTATSIYDEDIPF